jgi:lysophospholipase L1-like esterase
MTRSWAFWLAIVALVVLVVMVRSSGPAPPGNLLVVGDSLSAQSSTQIKRALQQDGWTVTVVAEPGAGITGGGRRHLDWSTVVHQKIALLHPELVYVELGTNGCGPGCTTVGHEIDALMTEMRQVPTVLWLDVRTNVPLPHADPPRINNEIEAATLRWPNLTRLDFDTWGSTDPHLLVGDGVHFNSSGQLVMADQVRKAIRAHSG